MFHSVLLVSEPASLYTVKWDKGTNYTRNRSRPPSQEGEEMKKISELTQAEFAELYRHWKDVHGKTRKSSIRNREKKRAAKNRDLRR